MIIGYESGKGWRIKNSWGSDWGDNGYGWIAEENTCWICNMTMAIVI
jgi:aminopeptidase C